MCKPSRIAPDRRSEQCANHVAVSRPGLMAMCKPSLPINTSEQCANHSPGANLPFPPVSMCKPYLCR
jgi:hypothetical protein